MKPVINHEWNVSSDEAIAIQVKLARQITKENKFTTIKRIAGVDVAYEKHSDKLVAAVVVLDAETLQIVESISAQSTSQFPYIPGLFSFREIPPLLSAFDKLQHIPDLIVCDAQGYAHPRRCGLATHLGILLDTPTIGCGKTKLLGEIPKPLSNQRGATSPIYDNNEVIGKALRTQDNINPIYVSIGHKIDLDTACQWILKLAPKYRLPETTRQADQLVKKLLKI